MSETELNFEEPIACISVEQEYDANFSRSSILDIGTSCISNLNVGWGAVADDSGQQGVELLDVVARA